MVRRVTIKNFKSIEDLSLDLGRCTVFIGANGSGKSNILEAIALASAAALNKLDNEFLTARGIRVSDIAAHMYCAFDSSSVEQPVELGLSVDRLDIDGDPVEIKNLLRAKQLGSYIEWINEGGVLLSPNITRIAYDLLEHFVSIEEAAVRRNDMDPEHPSWLENMADQVTKYMQSNKYNPWLSNYLIYSPEYKALRNFESEGQILPLGIRGEGLFRLLKSILSNKDDSRAKQIKEALKVIDWFSDFSLSDNLMSSEYSLQIRDRYLADDLAVFDQRSTNEGFLYLLFYFTLFCAEETPKFFALDNIDDSLNPRLSAETIKRLVELAKQHDKQFLATTHQPGLLDGLNLHDPDQILYVVFRNMEGRTAVRRIQPPKTNGSESVRLSEAFIRGYLGGLPNHF